MTKADLVNTISRSTGIERVVTLEIIEAFMKTVKESLANGENVYLRGFGSFIVKERAQKVARNISQQTSIILPKRRVPAFKASKLFSETMK